MTNWNELKEAWTFNGLFSDEQIPESFRSRHPLYDTPEAKACADACDYMYRIVDALYKETPEKYFVEPATEEYAKRHDDYAYYLAHKKECCEYYVNRCGTTAAIKREYRNFANNEEDGLKMRECSAPMINYIASTLKEGKETTAAMKPFIDAFDVNGITEAIKAGVPMEDILA